MEIADIIHQNHKKGLKVYPVITGFRFNIEIDLNGTKKKGEKEFTTATVNEAITETHIYYHKKLNP